MKKLLKRLGTLALCALLCMSTLSGCAIQKSEIAYTVYPLGYLIDRLKSDGLAATSIQENQIVQRATMKSDYAEILERSAVLFHIGPMEPYLSIYEKEISDSECTVVDLSVLNAVYDFQRYVQVVTDGEISYVETPYYRGTEFDMIDTDKRDLYLWLDPIAMMSMAKDIAKWLEQNYPEDSSLFETRYSDLEEDLINLDAQYQALASANEQNGKVIRFVSMTASFGNWQKTYGFQVYPIILSKYGVLPNEEQLALIEQRIVEDGVRYIVYEPNMSEDMIGLFNRVEEDLHLTRVELNNLSSLTDEEIASGKDYLDIMYENLSVLQTMVEDRPSVNASNSIDSSGIHDSFGEQDQ